MQDLKLAAPLAQALADKGYDSLTAVQTAVLADETTGRDLLVSAQTGSGKTVAFGLAIAPEVLAGQDRLLFADKPLALIVAPTRELALQVEQNINQYAKYLPLTAMAMYGGAEFSSYGMDAYTPQN